MSQWDKLLWRIRTLSGDIRFDELRKVLEHYGYQMQTPRGGSSHCSFRKSGCRRLTIPRHEPVKRVYVDMVRQVILHNTDKNSST